MRKALQILAVITLLVSCGPKPSQSITAIAKETDTYISKTDVKSTLEKEQIEGALTDVEGFKDIGKFKYTVYFDQKTKKLFKIENIEVTDKTISETYYFHDDKLVLIITNLEGKSNKLYVRKNKMISDSKMDAASQKILLEKAKRFQKAFQKEH